MFQRKTVKAQEGTTVRLKVWAVSIQEEIKQWKRHPEAEVRVPRKIKDKRREEKESKIHLWGWGVGVESVCCTQKSMKTSRKWQLAQHCQYWAPPVIQGKDSQARTGMTRSCQWWMTHLTIALQRCYSRWWHFFWGRVGWGKEAKRWCNLCWRNVRASYVQGPTVGAAGSISSHPQLTLTYMEICWRYKICRLGKCHATRGLEKKIKGRFTTDVNIHQLLSLTVPSIDEIAILDLFH